MNSPFLPFFQPRGVVVVGASSSPEKLGYGVARNLVQSGYPGGIHFVSHHAGEIMGHPIHTDLGQVPDPVDLAILIVPPPATPQVIQDCGQRGIKAAIIVSSGFREAGGEGAALERQCLEMARPYGMRLIGPNCIGVIDTHYPLDTTFIQPPMPEKGDIGFISHSGAFCAAIMDWARDENIGFSQIVSLGNQADVNETDMLPVLAADEHTRVIVLYMESVSDGRRFVEVAREVTRVKPVIALKVGRFESGQKAAASHTGALAASDIAFEAAFEKAGILRADTAEQMFDWAHMLVNSSPSQVAQVASQAAPHRPGRRGIAVLTNAGGPGVIAADALEQNGLSLAQLADTTLKSLSAVLPSSAAIHNPVDMLASASPENYAACLRILLEDPAAAAAMVILPPPPMFKAEVVAEQLVEVMAPYNKPVVVALLGSTLIREAAQRFIKANIPTFPFPERAASALGALFKRAEFLDRTSATTGRTIHRSSSSAGYSIEDLLNQYDIPTAPIKLAGSEAEAVAMANRTGYPVVMKIASPDIPHKSDMGGVVLDIQDERSLQRAYVQMMDHVRIAKPGARIDGVHIQRHIPGGQEVIVGMVRDPQFGPLMMFGSGGVEVEGLNDVSFALAPLEPLEAEKMIRKTWAGRKLQGFRNILPADRASVIDVLVKLSRLALEHEAVEEIEINPLRVLQQGSVALDVRMRSK